MAEQERLTYRQIHDEGWRLEGDLLHPPARWHWTLRDMQTPHLIDGVPREQFRAVRRRVLDHLAACDSLSTAQKAALQRAGWAVGEDARWQPPGGAEAAERRRTAPGKWSVFDYGAEGEPGLTANAAWRLHVGFGCLLEAG